MFLRIEKVHTPTKEELAAALVDVRRGGGGGVGGGGGGWGGGGVGGLGGGFTPRANLIQRRQVFVRSSRYCL